MLFTVKFFTGIITTLESGKHVAPGTFGKNNKRRPLNRHILT